MPKLGIDQIIASCKLRLLQGYISTVLAIGDSNTFHHQMFSSHIVGTNIVFLIGSLRPIIEHKELVNFIAKISEHIIPLSQSLKGPIKRHLKTELSIAKQIIKHPTYSNLVYQRQALEVLSLYQEAIIYGLHKVSVRACLESLAIEKWTATIPLQNQHIVITRLHEVKPLWQITNDIPSIARLESLDPQSFQTSVEPELALHEIIDKLVKTATHKQFLGALSHLCATQNKEMLQIIVQHANLRVLKTSVTKLKRSYRDQIQEVQKNVMSHLASEIYNAEELPVITARQLIKCFKKKSHAEYEALVHNFCANNPDAQDMVAVYKFAASKNNLLLQMLLVHSSAQSLVLVYDTLVIESLMNEVMIPTAIALGLGIYRALKYRISEGMLSAVLVSNIEEVAKLWSRRFAVFDEQIESIQNIAITYVMRLLAGEESILHNPPTSSKLKLDIFQRQYIKLESKVLKKIMKFDVLEAKRFINDFVSISIEERCGQVSVQEMTVLRFIDYTLILPSNTNDIVSLRSFVRQVTMSRSVEKTLANIVSMLEAPQLHVLYQSDDQLARRIIWLELDRRTNFRHSMAAIFSAQARNQYVATRWLIKTLRNS